MRFACLVYFDPTEIFHGSAAAEAALRDVGPFNESLRSRGVLVSDAALQLPHTARTVKVRDGKMSATDGPFLETKEILGGFLVIEANDLDEATRIAAEIPLARLGHVEVRPFVDFSQPRPRL